MPPRRRQISGKLLNEIVDHLSHDTQQELLSSSPRTLQLDGCDKDVEQLINAIITADNIEESLGDYNATGHAKDAKWTAELVLSTLKAVEERYPPSGAPALMVSWWMLW